jgi:AcrR family transcriptional regulator
MSPRRADPTARPALLEVAAEILRDEGPKALTARRVAAAAGTSTMLIYTHFDGMTGLVKEMVREGFDRLHAYFTSVHFTDDPVADLALVGRAYRCNAVVNPHLHSIMFGDTELGSFSLTDEDRHCGRFVLESVVECTARCIDAGRFEPADPDIVARHMWCGVHGMVALELGDYLIEPHRLDDYFDSQLASMMIGAGDRRDAARRSVAASRHRWLAEGGSWPLEVVRRRALTGRVAT